MHLGSTSGTPVCLYKASFDRFFCVLRNLKSRTSVCCCTAGAGQMVRSEDATRGPAMLNADNSYVELSSKPPFGSMPLDGGRAPNRSNNPFASSSEHEAGSLHANIQQSDFTNNPLVMSAAHDQSAMPSFPNSYSQLSSTPILASAEEHHTVTSHTVVEPLATRTGPAPRAPPPPPPPPPAGLSPAPVPPPPPKQAVGKCC